MIDSAEVSAMLELVNYSYLFAGVVFGLSLPKFLKLINLSVELLSKKLGKNKKKNSNNSEVMK